MECGMLTILASAPLFEMVSGTEHYAQNQLSRFRM